jgi:hypothetical protein
LLHHCCASFLASSKSAFTVGGISRPLLPNAPAGDMRILVVKILRAGLSPAEVYHCFAPFLTIAIAQSAALIDG